MPSTESISNAKDEATSPDDTPPPATPASAPASITAGPFLMERDFAGRQFVGTRRKQEDYYAFADASEKKEVPISRVLVALGDGLGAHLGGNVASFHVVDQFVKKYKEATLPPGWRLRVALEAANESLYALSSRITIDLPPMGTTLVGCIITKSKLWWISVGDSPFYIFRDGTLTRLNADHSLAPMLDERVANGTMTEEESQAHPDRHVLQSACLGFPLTMVDSRVDPYDLKSGDVLLIASDGILTLPTKQMEELISFGRYSSAGKIADALMFAVRCADHPRQDNTTIAVVKVP